MLRPRRSAPGPRARVGRGPGRLPEQLRVQRYLCGRERLGHDAIKNGEAYNGGIRELDREGVPPHWLVYFGTDDVGEALVKVEELGGMKLTEPIDMHTAKIGVAQDPQGAVFALYAGRFEP